jgi:hypothetical protein
MHSNTDDKPLYIDLNKRPIGDDEEDDQGITRVIASHYIYHY